jgi:hypothetical protein
MAGLKQDRETATEADGDVFFHVIVMRLDYVSAEASLPIFFDLCSTFAIAYDVWKKELERRKICLCERQ